MVLLVQWPLVIFRQMSTYEVRSSDWRSDVFSSDLLVLYAAGHKHDPLAQQPRKDVEAALAAIRLLDHDRHEPRAGLAQADADLGKRICEIAGFKRIVHGKSQVLMSLWSAYIGAAVNEFNPRLPAPVGRDKRDGEPRDGRARRCRGSARRRR